MGHRNIQFRDAIMSGPPEDWAFNILVDLPAATEGELAVYEERAIQRAYNRKPEAVLNGTVPVRGRTGTTGLTAPKSMIMDDDGSHISYAVAARRLNTTPKQMQKRLANYRKQGVTEVQFSMLRERSEKFRASL